MWGRCAMRCDEEMRLKEESLEHESMDIRVCNLMQDTTIPELSLNDLDRISVNNSLLFINYLYYSLLSSSIYRLTTSLFIVLFTNVWHRLSQTTRKPCAIGWSAQLHCRGRIISSRQTWLWDCIPSRFLSRPFR